MLMTKSLSLPAAYQHEINTYLEPIYEGKRQGIVTFSPAFESVQNATSVLNGKKIIMLAANNYLGLADHPEVTAAMKQAIDQYGASVCGSRMHNGTTDLHVRLEEKLAEFYNTEAAIVCNSGYMTNLAAITALTKDEQAIIITDSLNHMSIVDGIKLSNGKVKIFSHNSMAKLEYILSRNRDCPKKLIVVDGVYSMMGDIAPLDEIVKLAKQYDAMLMVDEAHSLGVFGESGRGICEYFGVEDSVQLKMATFSKSLASIGGCIASNADVCDFIRFEANSYLFSVGLTPASAAATLKTLEVMQKESWRREKLWHNTRLFKKYIGQLGFHAMDSQSPITPILLGDHLLTIKFIARLLQEGVYVATAVFPVVPRDKSMFRTTMTATLEEKDIEQAVAIIERVAKEFKII